MSPPTQEQLERRIAELERENTALRGAQAAAEDHERTLLAIIGNTPAPNYLKDTEFRYILVNQKYEELAHISIDTLRGKTDLEVWPAPIAEMWRAQDEAVVRAGHAVVFEEAVPLPDGELTFITVKFPVKDATGRLQAVGGFCTDITARKKIEREREALISELQAALREVAMLRKILPICAWCKQIRDDRGYWSQLEAYLEQHSHVEFTHSICPDCADKLCRRPEQRREG
ncbi:MAG: PAS domain-containing protein [Deltaproteobacteria bacterium]|nr:PAS domain-containing protein [Deltaproteobacteria bacterium]